MNSVQKLLLRLIKGIELHVPQNIEKPANCSLGRGSILNATDGKIVLGNYSRIGNSTELVASSQFGITVKDYSTIYSNCKVLGQVTIERYCLLATNIYISSGNHFAFEYPELLIKQQDQIVRAERTDIHSPVHIHEDVWLGNGVFVASGITIGRGAVVGAGTVVTKDIKPYQVVVGNPGKVIKNRLDFLPPSSISAKNQKDLPYFYQGFDHMSSLEIKMNKGFPILDSRAIIKLQVKEKIKLTGYSSNPSELFFSVGGTKHSQKVSSGSFSVQFDVLNSELEDDTLILETKYATQIFIQTVNCI